MIGKSKEKEGTIRDVDHVVLASQEIGEPTEKTTSPQPSVECTGVTVEKILSLISGYELYNRPKSVPIFTMYRHASIFSACAEFTENSLNSALKKI
jgi:hypothetical protein